VEKSPDPGQTGFPKAASFFSCTPSEGSGGASDARWVQIDPVADADAIVLTVGSGYPERLDVVEGSANRLFADTAYAWRLARPASVLTDVASFQTYSCAPR
jgi:hypothetical protein